MAAKKKQGARAGDVAAAVKVAREAVKAAKAALATHDLARLTAEERLHSSGKLREGEDRAILALFDTIDKFPATFQALADRDGGVDPSAVETAPARAALERRALLAPLVTELEELHAAVSDDVLSCAETAKAVSGPAYAIAKANAPVDAKLRKAVSATLDFYAKTAKPKGRAPKKAGNP